MKIVLLLLTMLVSEFAVVAQAPSTQESASYYKVGRQAYVDKEYAVALYCLKKYRALNATDFAARPLPAEYQSINNCIIDCEKKMAQFDIRGLGTRSEQRLPSVIRGKEIESTVRIQGTY